MNSSYGVITNNQTWTRRIVTMVVAALSIITLGLAIVSPVSAGSPASPTAGKDISYSYTYQTLTDADGSTGTYHFTGTVDYTKTGNTYTARTVCGYGKPPYPGASIAVTEYAGQYSVPYAIADTSYEGVKAFCSENFKNRTY